MPESLVFLLKKMAGMSTVVIVIITGLVSCSLSLATSDAGQLITVSVDVVNGNDTECYSLQELQRYRSSENASIPQAQRPCRTLNRALGNVDCYNSCIYQQPNSDPLQNVVVRLMDGVHRLSDCIVIDDGLNVTVQAVNNGAASVECAFFPTDTVQRMDGIRSCVTEGLVFRGVRFEHCGSYSPSVFLNRSSDILFEDCVFA